MEHVKCDECDGKVYERDDCTPVQVGDSVAYLCYHHTIRYTCDLCGHVEYSAHCRATHWCRVCAEKMDRVADDIIADFEGRSA